jgi:ribonuclease D
LLYPGEESWIIANIDSKAWKGEDMAQIRYHEGDLSAAAAAHYTGAVAIDTETLGLVPRRDRLCVVQLSPGDGTADVIRIAAGQHQAPNLVALLADSSRQKIFHYGRFDIAVLFHTFGVMATPVFCTKIASRLTRTYTDRHGLKDNLRELLEVDISKAQQQTDWAAETLSQAQLEYAASDVLHLHALRDKLTMRLIRDGRTELAAACFEFLPARAKLDLLGWDETDIFAHS